MEPLAEYQFALRNERLAREGAVASEIVEVKTTIRAAMAQRAATQKKIGRTGRRRWRQ